MNSKNGKDMDHLLEIDRMINEGLGGGMIEYDYQHKQLELPYKNGFKKKKDTKEKDVS